MSEREQIYESMRAMYAHYLKYLLLSAVGVVVVAGIYADSGDALGLEAGSTLALVVALIAPILCLSWAAGWAYLNVELWAYRHYLAYLDSQVAASDSVGPTLHGDVFMKGVYDARPRCRWFKKARYTAHLDVIIALFPAAVGFWVLAVAVLALWPLWGIWGHFAAVAYGATLAFGYGYVFFVKSKIDAKVLEQLPDSPA